MAIVAQLLAVILALAGIAAIVLAFYLTKLELFGIDIPRNIGRALFVIVGILLIGIGFLIFKAVIPEYPEPSPTRSRSSRYATSPSPVPPAFSWIAGDFL